LIDRKVSREAASASVPETLFSLESRAREKLGVLEGIQEFFWATEPTRSRLALILAEIEGRSTVDDWRRAVKQIRQRYPLLCAGIRKSPGERPYLESLPDTDIPLRVVPYEEGVSVDALMARELANSFGRGEGPLARVALHHSSDRTIIILVVHHAAYDGLTNVNIVHDLIAAAAGEAVGEALPVHPTTGELLGLPAPSSYTERLSDSAAVRCPRLDLPTLKVTSGRIEADRVRVLLERARKENTSVHGVLVATAILAAKRQSNAWQTQPLICLSPVDLRPMLNLDNAAGVLTTIHPTIVMPTDAPDFWDFARAVTRSIRTTISVDTARRGVIATRAVVDRETDPYDLSTVDRDGFFNHDMMITNYGVGKVRSQYGHLELIALYPSHFSGSAPQTQTLSAITVNGALHLNHASRQPLPSFLDIVLEGLGQVCSPST
jgi:hypothetical protein